MNELTLPPSPNWYLSTILACASDGTVAWGSRNSIVIAKSDDDKKLNYKIIDKASTERITSVAFAPLKETDNYLSLVSSADDHTVKVWNLSDLSLQMKNTQLASNQKVIGVDWSKHNPNLICFVSEDGILITWDIKYNTTQEINLTKITGNKWIATCIACCPHDSNLVSIGSKSGLICLVDVRAIGKTNYKYHKLRGHNKEIVSLSWCPVPINVFQEEETKEFLLASGAKDREIYIWKAGTDYRYEVKLTFASTPLDSSHHKTKVSSSAGNFTAVCWLEPTTLLTSSPWGELLMWDLTGFNPNKKFTSALVHAIHTKGLFSIAGLNEKSIDKVDTNKTLEDDNWRIKDNIKAIWTVSQDRQVICSSIVHGETIIEYKVPTMGGFVYCMSACSVDTSQIAFGVGDNMIRLWNLSEPYEKSIDLQILWEKIMGKVRALAWHPEKENLLAFATDEGRIGVYDTNVKKPPILYRLYHRYTVYRIGWGPAPHLNEHALYSCADYEVVYYNHGKTEEAPKSVVKKDCTDFSWKPDYSLLALGFVDGSISFLKPDLSETGLKIRVLTKPIQCFAWHPESTASDMNFSSMKNYLAVATTDSNITICDISSKLDNGNDSNEPSYRLVAILSGHNGKVVCLAWSPHISGYLVSGAYDYSALVWKVETQELIASFTGHLGPIQCCMWSPFSQDLILTGSADFTLRIWSISKQGISVLPHTVKTSTKGKRTKKKKAKDSVISDTSIDASSLKEISDRLSVVEKLTKLSLNESDEINKATKKKKKKVTYFPKYAEINKDNDQWCDTVKNLLDFVENENYNSETGTPNYNDLEHNPIQEHKIIKPEKPFLFLGNKKNLEEALEHEKNLLKSIGYYNIVTEIDLWRGNLKENLEDALKNKRLNDFLVSLAASISMEFWIEMCEGYAVQLNSEEHYHKAVSYLLCLNKVNEAIDIFVNAKLYKEAYALASSKLSSEDLIVKNILVQWANSAEKDGHFQNASECYIKLKDFTKAAKVLERRKDLKSLILAIDVAERSKDNSLMASIAEKAVLEALVTSDIQTAKLIVNKYPIVQYRELEIEIFDELNKLFENFGDETIFKWLKGAPSACLLEGIKFRFASNSTKYSLLMQKDVFPVLLNEKIVQVNVSHQFALSILAEQEEMALKHIMLAFDIILQYEKTDCAIVEGKLPFLIKYFSIIDSKSNIINNYQNELGKSLRGFLCHAIIDWYLKNKLIEEQKSECIDLIIEILQECIVNLLDREAVKCWTIANQIKNLETKLTEVMVNVPNGGDLNDAEPLIEQLDQLRNERTQFIEQRVSSPNPLLSYGLVMEFINKIPNENVRYTMNEFVMEVWQKAIS
ncbi:gem-associated protein 5-like [Phymastichus coffea]|uniref:gem-associated protein 5-like n=1 Tax=Phymastichus coffea TaxID=108790 RepID=UPI00273AC97E|nr:gem-associated protein 5-like [Phymastichus coffea]